MPWIKIEGGNSKIGKGIRVVLKNGTVEDFKNKEGIEFLAQEWSSELLYDKSDGEIQVGYYDPLNEEKWQRVAFFPAGTFKFVRVLLE